MAVSDPARIAPGAQRGVETLIGYPSALHETGAYADLLVRPEHVQAAARTARTLLSLPMGPRLADGAVHGSPTPFARRALAPARGADADRLDA